MAFPKWAEAGFWGFVSGAALLIGAAVGYLAPVPRRIVALIMGFGAGVLISALAFELMDEAFKVGGFTGAAGGFLVGAAVYTAANRVLAARGAKHRKRSGEQQPSEEDNPGSGTAMAVGALIDGVPESIAIGVSLLAGGAVSVATVAAVFLSNIPEGLSSSAGMRKANRPASYVFGLWGGIAVVSALAAVAGAVLFRNASPGVVAFTTATAAGGILAMLSDTMIPEAFEEAHDMAGLATTLGFLAAFALSKLGEH